MLASTCLYLLYAWFASGGVDMMSGLRLFTNALRNRHAPDRCPFNSLFSRTPWVSLHLKVRPVWILMKQEMIASAAPCSNHLHLSPDRWSYQHLTTQFFLLTGCSSWCPTNGVKVLNTITASHKGDNQKGQIFAFDNPIFVKGHNIPVGSRTKSVTRWSGNGLFSVIDVSLATTYRYGVLQSTPRVAQPLCGRLVIRAARVQLVWCSRMVEHCIAVQNLTGLMCGHEFCRHCWCQYLTVKIMDEGMGQVGHLPSHNNIFIRLLDRTVIVMKIIISRRHSLERIYLCHWRAVDLCTCVSEAG